MTANSAIEWTDHTINPWWGCTKVSPACTHCYAEGEAGRWQGVKWGPGEERQQKKHWRKTAMKLERKAVGELKAWRGRASSWGQQECPASHASGVAHQLEEVGRSAYCMRCGDLFRERAPAPPRVFCLSMGDWLDPEVRTEWLAELLEVIALTPHLDWLLLTKRPELWEERLHDVIRATHGHPDEPCDPCPTPHIQRWLDGTPPDNVWVGVTVENQEWADKRIPELLKIPARVRFLSCEPLLGPVDLKRIRWSDGKPFDITGISKEWAELAQVCAAGLDCEEGLAEKLQRPLIDWVIAGGESGPKARPSHPDWFRSLRDQCQAAGVPYFFKQFGAWGLGFGDTYPTSLKPKPGSLKPWMVASSTDRKAVGTTTYHAANADGTRYERLERVGKKKAGRELDGRTWDEVPG